MAAHCFYHANFFYPLSQDLSTPKSQKPSLGRVIRPRDMYILRTSPPLGTLYAWGIAVLGAPRSFSHL